MRGGRGDSQPHREGPAPGGHVPSPRSGGDDRRRRLPLRPAPAGEDRRRLGDARSRSCARRRGDADRLGSRYGDRRDRRDVRPGIGRAPPVEARRVDVSSDPSPSRTSSGECSSAICGWARSPASSPTRSPRPPTCRSPRAPGSDARRRVAARRRCRSGRGKAGPRGSRPHRSAGSSSRCWRRPPPVSPTRWHATGEASVEWKLDGARVQVHRDGDDVVVWTRNGNDVTARLPGIVAVARALPVTAVVLDGEAIGLAEEDERPEVFQDLMSRFGRHDGEAGADLLVRFFDVLHHDGEDLVDTAAPRASRGPRSRRRRVGHPPHPHRRRQRGRGVPRGRAGPRARRRDGEGPRLVLRGGSARRLVAEGKAGQDARPRGARRRVGPRAAARLALESPPRCPRRR